MPKGKKDRPPIKDAFFTDDKDGEICEIFYTSNGKRLNSNYFNDNWLRNHPNIIKYLKERYADSSSIYETLYRIKNGIEIRPVCVICGNPVNFDKQHKFMRHCSAKCSADDKLTIKRRRETAIEKYGVDSFSKTKEYIEKTKRTSLERYGVEHHTKRESYKRNIREINLKKYGTEFITQSEEFKNKSKETCRKKYGVDFSTQSDYVKNKIKETCRKNYGVDFYLSTEECKEKARISRIKRTGSLGSSKENILYEKLVDAFGEIEREYKSVDYPYHADFYVKRKNLYIEFNGMWVHNTHPFNPESKDDAAALDVWLEKAKTSSYYKRAIYIWTKSDVEKREFAKNHNLNWIEGWSIEEILEKIKNL